MTRRKAPASKPVEAEPIEDGFPVKDHPDQAVDTPLPGDTVNEEHWQALVDNYEGDPEDDEEATDG